jgi:hypothetical protein
MNFIRVGSIQLIVIKFEQRPKNNDDTSFNTGIMNYRYSGHMTEK